MSEAHGQTALVTGAGGFVCRHIVEALHAQGLTVIAVDRAFDADLRALWSGKDIRLVEVSESDALPDLQADFLVHGAAVTAAPEDLQQTPEANFRANIEPVLAALAWARQQHVRRSVFISSSAVFLHSGPGPLHEETPTVHTGLYAAAKALMESLVRTYRHDYGLDAVAVRLGPVYGPGERVRSTRPRLSLIAQMIHAALRGETLHAYAADSPVDWTYAPDIGRAVYALLTATQSGYDLYHLTSGEALTASMIADAIRALLPDTAVQMGDVPPGPLRGWMVNERFKAATGFDAWTPFSTGLAETLTWQRQQLAETEQAS